MTLRYHATDDMEGAVRALAARHRTVLVLMDYKCIRPIRMRTKAMLSDLDIDWCWAWKSDAQQHIDLWQRKGGILQYRSDPNKRKPVAPVADAMLFVECPLQWERFESLVASARQEVAIYRPPLWDNHARTIDALYPPREAYQALEALIGGLATAKVPRFRASHFERSVTFKAKLASDLFDWNEKQLRYLLRGYKYAVHRWHPYTLHFKPEHADLVWAWDWLKAQPKEGKAHVLRFNTIRPRVAGFDGMLKQLVRGKYVRPEECIYDADAAYHGKDIDEREAINDMRRSKWRKMRDFVDELAEYPI